MALSAVALTFSAASPALSAAVLVDEDAHVLRLIPRRARGLLVFPPEEDTGSNGNQM